MGYVVRHKWFVFVACYRLGIPWRGLVHDLSKFLPSEWIPYTNFFYGPKPSPRDSTGYYKPTDTGDKAFDFAWLLHQKRNRHHWQWWLTASTGKCYNARSDLLDEEIICEHNKPIKIKNFASLADSSVVLRIFRFIRRGSEEHNAGLSAKSTGKNIVRSTGKQEKGQEGNASTTKKDIGVIQNILDKKPKTKLSAIANYALSIMGAIRLLVLVVVNNTTSFCALTILTEAETNIGQSLKKKEELLYIVGLLSTDFQKDFVFFVPIVIRRMGIMDTAHIGKNSEGGVKVLEMPENDVREMIADWRGAGRAQRKPDILAWYYKNRHKMILHAKTREKVEAMLEVPLDLKA